MANILPENEVRGSLLQIYSEPKVRGISNCKLPMIEVEGSMIHGIHHLTPYYGAYNIYYSGQADYISGFCFSIAFLNLELAWLVSLLLLFD